MFTFRGFQVMIDRDLAEKYQEEIRVLNEGVKRIQNENLISYFVISRAWWQKQSNCQVFLDLSKNI
ncbi:ORF6N domain-containing protein [Aquiflexum sp.]|uniref:ORF6N domain-containing protein n=1 Tax=Aquiflexum sp. TaxID=1872584 RepID=UPI0035947EBB